MLVKWLGNGGRVAVEQLTDVPFNALEHEFETSSSPPARLAATVLGHRLVHALAADLCEKLEREGQAFERSGKLYRISKNQIMAARKGAVVHR